MFQSDVFSESSVYSSQVLPACNEEFGLQCFVKCVSQVSDVRHFSDSLASVPSRGFFKDKQFDHVLIIRQAML